MQEITVIKKDIFTDKRGSFFEAYNENIKSLIGDVFFKQDSISISNKNVLRGMHYQFKEPMGKMINVVQGCIIEKILDIRKDSSSFGEVVTFEMDSSSDFALYIPPGFAHGFLSMCDNTIIMYKQTSLYNPHGEGAINPFSNIMGLSWPVEESKLIVSEKDLSSQSFEDYSKQGVK